MLRTFGVALEQTAALMGIAVQPLARSDSVSENMSRFVRSSRSCGYLTITAITRTFNVMFIMITRLMVAVLMSSKVLASMPPSHQHTQGFLMYHVYVHLPALLQLSMGSITLRLIVPSTAQHSDWSTSNDVYRCP